MGNINGGFNFIPNNTDKQIRHSSSVTKRCLSSYASQQNNTCVMVSTEYKHDEKIITWFVS
jgi:hypothetical protein